MPSAPSETDPLHVFVSYAHEDKKWLERLQVHLKPLGDLCRLELWADTRIKSGTKWKVQIAEAVRRAKVGVLLVSADFLASDFVQTDELPPLLASADLNGTIIVPVIVGPCLFNRIQHLSQFHAANDPARPLMRVEMGEAEGVFAQLAERIFDIAEEHRKATKKASEPDEQGGVPAMQPGAKAEAEDVVAYYGSTSSEKGENFLDQRDFLRLPKLGDWIYDSRRARIIGAGQGAFLVSRREYGEEPFYVHTKLTFSNFEVTTVRPRKLGMNAGLVFAWKNEDQRLRYYNVLLTGTELLIERNGFVEPGAQRHVHLTKPVKFKIEPNEIVDIRLDVNEELIRVSSTDRELLTLTKPPGLIGRVGLRPWRSQVECVEFTVSGSG